jgi:hypothetical protein
VEIARVYGTMLHATGAPLTDVEPLYRQVLAAEPLDGIALLNLSQLRFQLGAQEEAVALVRRSLKAELSEGEKVEALFCWFAFEGSRESLRELRGLLIGGSRSTGWDLTTVVGHVVAAGHQEPDLLRVLAAVVVDKGEIRELDAFPRWRELGP